jgi:hypothetical protein
MRANTSHVLSSTAHGCTQMGIYGRLFFVSVRTNKRHHHHHEDDGMWPFLALAWPSGVGPNTKLCTWVEEDSGGHVL